MNNKVAVGIVGVVVIVFVGYLLLYPKPVSAPPKGSGPTVTQEAPVEVQAE